MFSLAYIDYAFAFRGLNSIEPKLEQAQVKEFLGSCSMRYSSIKMNILCLTIE